MEHFDAVGDAGLRAALRLVRGAPAPVTADEAAQMGLLNKVVPSDQLLDAAIEMGRQIAGNTPAMVQGIKQMMIEHLGRGWQEMYDAEKSALSTTLKPSPVSEGFKEFLSRKATSQA